MIKHKIALGLAIAVLSSPFMFISTAANAWHHHGYRHSCCCYGLKNMSLVYKVVREFRASPALYDQPIYVSARGHELTLSGQVGTASQRAEAIKIARYTCGVSLVIDNMRMQNP